MENELRIGNLVFDVWTNQVCEVDGILINGDVVTLDSTYDSGYRNMSEKPIPLTEEWLLKFGFEQKDVIWNDKSVSKGVFVKMPYFTERTEYGFPFCEIHDSAPFRKNHFISMAGCVHQLQNLYFALTGEELEIKKVN